MNIQVVLLAALVAVAAAAPMDVAESADQDAFAAAFEEDARPKRQPQAQDRDDPYGAPPPYQPPAPVYKPEPSYHKPVLPAQYKAFVKTDYDGNFKWGVKHNIAPIGHH